MQALAYPWIDTHCHLNAAEFDPDRTDVLFNCAQNHVKHLVIPTVHLAECEPLLAFCQQKRHNIQCLAAVGLHPIYIATHQDEDLTQLRHILTTQGQFVSAIGEIGLDFYLPDLDREKQIAFFVAQLKLAREFDYPVLIHARKSVDLILKYLRQIKVKGGIIHAFNGSLDQAYRLAEYGFKFGFGGTVTYERARHIRTLLHALPIETIVLETDAPDMPPAFLPSEAGKARRHSPEYLPKIASVCAQIKGLDLAIFNQQIYHNTQMIFPERLSSG